MRVNCCLLTCGLVIVQVNIFSGASNATMSTVLNSIFDGYDKKLPPNYDKVGLDKQVQVTVNMYVNSMYTISEMNMDFSMSIFLRERWVDDRLQYDDTLNISRLVVDNSMFGNIWMPDMYIPNEKSSGYHEGDRSLFMPNTSAEVLTLSTAILRSKVVIGHSTEDLKFIWSENAVSVAETIENPQFSITEIKSYCCEKDYYGIVYPCIGVTFVLERNYAYYIIQIFIPSILITVLSWVSFWLDPTAVPARISLGLLTVLTMTTQSSGARANLPRVSYIKAIDVYMATCISFVFLAMIEFAFVNVLTRVDRSKQKEETSQTDVVKETKTNNFVRCIRVKPQTEPEDEGDEENEGTSVEDATELRRFGLKDFIVYMKRMSPKQVDNISRVVFPIVFAIFNLVYWIHYFFFDKCFER